jgi:hypothetical protein
MISTEKATQAAILNYLVLKRVFHWRNNTGAFKSEHGSFIRYGSPGSPDIFAVLPPSGQLLGIEVKDTRGRLNENQEGFRDRLERAGGRYIVARSLDDVICALAA